MSPHRLTYTFYYRSALTILICISLLSLPGPQVSSTEASQAQSQHSQRPRRGRPEGTLLDLREVENESGFEREAPGPIPSTVRSPRVPLRPWDGRRVGDPETRKGADAGGEPDRTDQTRRAHARGRVKVVAPPAVPDDQFVQNFFTSAISRAPSSSELSYWNDQLRVAYTQGQTSMTLVGIALGKALFESAEYTARNRDNHWYVYDLYKTFLMRDPDASGWAYWESVTPTNGRENVRRAFEVCPEFAGIVASIVPNGAATANAASLISAQVDPRNQPGKGMLTRDASWSVPLISLPGRNGLDLGLVLSYSSLVWTRSGPDLHFDEDNGFPSPGFRLGFPTVQRKLFDAQTAKNAFLMITASGERVELRQVGTSNVYEAADSSYLQLIDNSPSLLLRATDGTQLSFYEMNNEFRCTQVKDRNGNYLTVSLNGLGQPTTVTDTLGRVVTFNYDSNANLISITQSWNGQPSHQWVSFAWGTRTMQSSFTSGAVVGTANGQVLPVLTQVSLNDTSYYTFEYTNSLQLSTIRNYFGAIERNATTFTYETPAGDVPRLLDTRVSARNWTGVNGVPAQVIAQYSVAADGACVLTAPDGTTYKEYYGTGWQRGLTTLSEVWSGGLRQKWTTTAWTQDNTSVGYETNPRVLETNVYDASGNRRRTTIDYGSYGQYGLPYSVKEYAADGVSVLRETITDYNLSQAYLNQRLLGLVSQVQLTTGSGVQSKISYEYDEPARLQGLPAAATQHDAAYYGTSFTARGNVTAVARWDSTDPNNAATKLTSYTNYFTTGTPVSGLDPAGHSSSIGYTDSFSDSINRNTFAYPTTITDADGSSSYVQYNFDFGATTRTQSPAPAGQSQGAIQTLTYNSLGQLERTTTSNNGAYKRFWYGADYTASYATVNNVADELYAIEVFDGLGRVIGAAGNHPGSSGGYRLVNTIYNQLGQAWKVSNPTEVNSAWAPSGDDIAGMYYTQQSYDWKGRPLVTTNPDGTTKEASYAGCGCAGGEVVTLTDEGTIDAGVAKRRQQKVYSDVLGRAVKTEILNWQGGSVYSAAVTTYNARDQVTQVREYAGAEGSGPYQDTTMTYDGYGRIKTKHVPEHVSGTAVTWNYNADDTVQSTTDPRGSTAAFTYNNRHLPTGVTYTLSGSPTINASYSYDAAGNRTAMTDAMGNVSYSYNQLSQMSSEVRYYAQPNRSYSINYTYNLNGQLRSISYPGWSQSVGYNFDAAGRLNSVTGSGFVAGYYQGAWPNWTWVQQPVPTFASNISYRAAGSVKQMSYGNNLQVALAYNARLQPTQYQVSNFASSSTITSTYQYYNDGKVRYSGRTDNNIFDRAFRFDNAGRLKEALTGAEARGGSTPDGPFRESYSYDVWGNTVSQTDRLWSGSPVTENAAFVNNTRPDWVHDNNGFVLSATNDGYQTDYGYDAAGRRIRLAPWFTTVGFFWPAVEFAYEYDGEGRASKQTDTRREEDPETGQVYSATTTTYYLHSTMLGGQVVAELDAQGNQTGTHIYAQGMHIASASGGSQPSVWWEYTDPVTGSKGTADVTRAKWDSTELNTLGADVTYPPPPLGAQSYQPPIYAEPVKQSYYQVEGWVTQDYTVDSRYLNAVNQNFDRHMANAYWAHGFRDWAMAIVANNPNVNVLSLHYDRQGKLMDAGLRWGAQAASFLLDIDRDIQSGRLIKADSQQYGEVVGYQLDSPESSLIQDDPETILSEGSPNCSFTISFKSGTFYDNETIYPNGPGEVVQNGITYFGLGFTVEGKTKGGGGIGHIGADVNTSNPKGKWTLDQYTSNYAKQNGDFVRIDGRLQRGGDAWRDITLKGVHFATDWTNRFARYDHPSLLANVADTYKNQAFMIKVFNATEACEAEFHIVQRGNTIHWGRGGQGIWPK
jgi:YD repeat-containing protein